MNKIIYAVNVKDIPVTKITVSTKMKPFKFAGEFESFTEPQLKLVESVLQKQGFKEGNVTVYPIGQKGDNYIGNVKRFICESDGVVFKMIGKAAPTAAVIRKIMTTVIFFNNEIVMYREVIPKFNNLQDAAGIPANERVRFPVCYDILDEAPNEFILLEDLSESNFETLSKFQFMTNDTVRLVLKDLAKFHSLSYALKELEPETFKYLVSKLANLWALLDDDDSFQMLLCRSTESDIKALTGSEKYKMVIAGSVSLIKAQANELSSYEKSSEYSVIHQGDCWSNNIMFRLENGKAVENVMIDYQLSKQSNPAADLLYFIFNCTDHDTRSKHYLEWIDYYHKILVDSLANYGLKSDCVFPRDRLDANLRRYAKLQFSLAILATSFFLRQPDNSVDFNEIQGSMEEVVDRAVSQMKIVNLDSSTLMMLKHRVMGLVDSCLEFSLL